MMPPSASTPAPEAPRRAANMTAEELGNRLWEKIIASTIGLEIDKDFETRLHEIVQRGANRMFAENRTTPADIVLAEENSSRLVATMRKQARLLNHPESLDEDTLIASEGSLKIMRFELWPFWPW
jgi:hypothetical protein